MKQIKLSLLLLAMLIAPTLAHADDMIVWFFGLNGTNIEANGIHYFAPKNSTELYIKQNADNKKITGEVKIPSTLTADGKQFTVTDIGVNAFKDCTGITSVVLPYTIKQISFMAFSGCKGLKSINMPSTIKSIENQAFAFCNELTSITIPYSVKELGEGAFIYCKNLTSVNLQASLKIIEKETFCGCSELGYITIPGSVTEIRAVAFQFCRSLTSITIPASVMKIGYGAFKDCSGLKNITCQATYPPTCENKAFEGIDKSSCVLYVPAGSVNRYRTAAGWREFGLITSM